MNTNSEAVLLGRIAAREERPSDWQALRLLAREDPSVWGRLADTLEDDMWLAQAAAPDLAVADRVELGGRPRRAGRLATWGGWLAALVVLGLWLVAPAGRGGSPEAILGELPRVMVDARPAPGGRGYEVVYVRGILERAVVDKLFEVGEDEHGRPAPREATLASFRPPERF